MNPDKTKEYQLLQSIINLLDQTSIETRKKPKKAKVGGTKK